jgi:hypothetical protein
MAVTAIVPDRALAGFEHRTFACAACGATERRLVLGRDQPPLPQPQPEVPRPAATPRDDEAARATPTLLSPAAEGMKGAGFDSGPPKEAEPDLPKEAQATTAWTRAVEKLRHRQADLSKREEAAKKASWNVRFDEVWQRLVPDSPQFSRPNGGDKKIRRRRSWSPQVSARMVIPRRRPVLHAPVVESSPEQIRKFNELWDSLGPRQLPPPARADESSLAPLPRSMSLVPIEPEQPVSAAMRAILLLRGTQHAAIAA